MGKVLGVCDLIVDYMGLQKPGEIQGRVPTVGTVGMSG